MSFLREVEGAVNRFLRRGDIGASVAHYEKAVGADAGTAQAYSDAGPFRAQLERLFSLATPQDYPAFEAMARAAVACSLTNRYYRAADLLKDVVDALESPTFLAPGPNGEPALADLRPELRHGKVDRVRTCWLTPRKIAAVEEAVAAHARHLGRTLPYPALARFERQVGRFFALLEESETAAFARRLDVYLLAWKDDPSVRGRFPEPALGVGQVVEALEGWLGDEEERGLRTKAGWPVRLANVVPEERSALLDVAWRRLGVEVAPPAPPRPVEPVPLAGPAPAPRPRKAKSPAPAEEVESDGTGPLLVVLSCPKCGGSFTADDETVSAECGYCSSLLILAAAERDEIYVDSDRIEDGNEVLEIVVQYRVQAYRAELIGDHKRQKEDPEAMPAEWWLRLRLDAFEKKLRSGATVRRAERVFAPYWHMSGLVAQGAVGRHTHSPKVMRVRAWSVEHTVPGYGEQWNLRDRGLRLAHARVAPLTVERVREIGSFLPWVPIAERTYREVEKWRAQDLEPGFESVAKHGDILFPRRVVAYRPYWFVELTLGGETSWVMVDGVFRTIAGYPSSEEATALLRARVSDPLNSAAPSYRRVHVVPSRCPDCGHDQHPDPHHHVVVCPNCHLGLEAKPTGIEVVGYDHLTVEGETVGGDYLPFWRFSFEAELPGGVVRDLAALKAGIFGENAPSAWVPRGDSLWVPAFRLLGSEPGDEAFQRVVEAIHVRRNEVSAGKIPLGLRTRHWGASLSAAEAAQLGRLTTIGLHSKASAARLNTILFTRTMSKPRLTLANPRLTMVPFDRSDRELQLPGTLARVPLLLLEGGPELDALRVSVHRIRRDL